MLFFGNFQNKMFTGKLAAVEEMHKIRCIWVWCNLCWWVCWLFKHSWSYDVTLHTYAMWHGRVPTTSSANSSD